MTQTDKRAQIAALYEADQLKEYTENFRMGWRFSLDHVLAIMDAPTPAPTAPQETAGEWPERIWVADGCRNAPSDNRTGQWWSSSFSDRLVEFVRADMAHPTPAAATTDNVALVEVDPWTVSDRLQRVVDAVDAGRNGNGETCTVAVSLIRAALASRPAEATSRERVEVGPTDAGSQVQEYLDGVVGVVEANTYETLCLWQEYTGRQEQWDSARSGFGACVGHVNGRPVCISLLTATVNGYKIAIIDPTSELVDWKLIDAWLVKNLPKTAFRENGYVRKENTMNFPNVLPRAALPPKASDEEAAKR